MKLESSFSNYEYITGRTDLIPGTIFKIDPLRKIDGFIKHIANVLSEENNPEIMILKPQAPVNVAVSEIIDQGEFRKKFIGELRESTMLILPTDISWITRAIRSIRGHLDTEHPKAANFLVATKMYTTGKKGSIGNVFNEISLCGDSSDISQFYVKVRSVKSSQTLKEVEAHIKDSAVSYAEILKAGLKLVFSADLPS